MKFENYGNKVFTDCIGLIDRSDFDKVKRLKHACLKGNIEILEDSGGSIVGYIIWCKVSKHTVLGCAKFNWFPLRYWEKDEGNITFVEDIVLIKKEPYRSFKAYVRRFLSKHKAVFFRTHSVSRLWVYSKQKRRYRSSDATDYSIKSG